MRSNLLQLIYCIAISFLVIACKKTTGDELPPPPAPVDINDIVETKPPVLKPVTTRINSAVAGLYASVPYLYDQTIKRYPLLIFIPGAGQYGNGGTDLPTLLNDGIAELLDEKIFPPAFTVNGKSFSFITLSPQLSRYTYSNEIKELIDYAIQHYRIDTSRIYLSGLSIGGTISAETAAAYTSTIAAIVPIAGVINYDPVLKCQHIANGNLPVWVLQNKDDPIVSSGESVSFVSMINSFNPSIPPKLTLFNVYGHDAWTKAINPSFRENNMNIYEWMLQYKR